MEPSSKLILISIISTMLGLIFLCVTVHSMNMLWQRTKRFYVVNDDELFMELFGFSRAKLGVGKNLEVALDRYELLAFILKKAYGVRRDHVLVSHCECSKLVREYNRAYKKFAEAQRLLIEFDPQLADSITHWDDAIKFVSDKAKERLRAIHGSNPYGKMPVPLQKDALPRRETAQRLAMAVALVPKPGPMNYIPEKRDKRN